MSCALEVPVHAAQIQCAHVKTKREIHLPVSFLGRATAAYGLSSYARTRCWRWRMCIHIRIKQLPDHALVLRLVLFGMRLEELHAPPAQCNCDLYALVSEGELVRRRKEVAHNANFSDGFTRVFCFRGHRCTAPPSNCD